MGLCKCPKKKVTNQFCFEHRVNVCEHCIVSDHTKCVVQSYLQWLNDSEYDPKCSLCNLPLDSEEECSRLVCYDVFHSSCLEKWGVAHPVHTAPAGYKCPVCSANVFPAPQLASPVALALKDQLQTWSWSRKVLALPMNPDDEWKSKTSNTLEAPNTGYIDSKSTESNPVSSSNLSKPPTQNGAAIHNSSVQSYVSDDVFSGQTLGGGGVSDYRDRSHSLRVSDDSCGRDEEETDKYKRRSAIVWFKRWWRSYQPFGSSKSRYNGRTRMFIILCILFVATLVLLLTRGRSEAARNLTDLDPAFDPLNNPNIHIQQS